MNHEKNCGLTTFFVGGAIEVFKIFKSIYLNSSNLTSCWKSLIINHRYKYFFKSIKYSIVLSVSEKKPVDQAVRSHNKINYKKSFHFFSTTWSQLSKQFVVGKNEFDGIEQFTKNRGTIKRRHLKTPNHVPVEGGKVAQ